MKNSTLSSEQAEKSCFNCLHVYLDIIIDKQNPAHVPYWTGEWECGKNLAVVEIEEYYYHETDEEYVTEVPNPASASRCTAYTFSPCAQTAHKRYGEQKSNEIRE